jgi:hypothetical protein
MSTKATNAYVSLSRDENWIFGHSGGLSGSANGRHNEVKMRSEQSSSEPESKSPQSISSIVEGNDFGYR